MKKLLLALTLLSTAAFSGGVTNNNSSQSRDSHSSSSESELSSEEESSEEDDQMDLDEENDPDILDGAMDWDTNYQDEQPDFFFDQRAVMQEMQDALKPQSFLNGETLIAPSIKRPAESAENPRPTKRLRDATPITTPNILDTPVPSEGGILGQLLDYFTSTWHEPFFSQLDVLDTLSLYAASNRAHMLMGADLILTINTLEDLHRLIDLPTRSHAFLHLREIRFDFDDFVFDDGILLVDFLENNIPVLLNLERLDMGALDETGWGTYVFEAAHRHPEFARLLIRTNCRFTLSLEEETLEQFFAIIRDIPTPDLLKLIRLRIADEERDLHRWFLEGTPNSLDPFALFFEGGNFGDEVMHLFARRLLDGFFPNLRVLRFLDTGLDQDGFARLGILLVGGYLNSLEFLGIDHGEVDEGIVPENALGLVLGELPDQGDLLGFLPNLVRFEVGADLTGRIDPASIELFFDVIERNAFASLRILRLNAQFDNEQADHLIRVLPHLPHLEALYLVFDLALSGEAIKRVRAALPKNCKLNFF